MKSFVLIALWLSLNGIASAQEQQRSHLQTIVVTGTDFRQFGPVGMILYFTVQQTRDYDTDKVKSYEQALKELKSFLTESNIKKELVYVRRFDGDSPDLSHFGMFSLEVVQDELGKIREKLDIEGVEVGETKYKYDFDYAAVELEMIKGALDAGTKRAAKIAHAMNMQLGKIIEAQEAEVDKFFDRSSLEIEQKVSCTMYLIFEVIPKTN